MGIPEDKQGLRALMRDRQAEWQRLDNADAERACALRVRLRVEALPAFSSARTVLLYTSLPGELPTADLLEEWSRTRRIALPVVHGDSLILREYLPGCLSPGYKGIPEPGDDSPLVNPEEIDLAVIPGVAFDAEGHRLGHGKGFYDRLLPSLHCPVVGVAFPWRIVPSVPFTEHDCAVDYVFC